MWHPIRLARRLMGAHRWVRHVLWAVAGSGGMGTMGYVGGVCIRVHDRLLAETDSPEYAADISLNPLSGWHWPTWRMPGIPAVWLWVAAIVVVVVAMAVLVACWPMRKPDNPFDRDPRRLFSDADREFITQCTGNQCEHRMCGLIRCPRMGEQMDHHYPWSRGGATSRRNLVWLCAKHNRRKSDRVPSRLSTWLLVRARESYWPRGERAAMIPDGLADMAHGPDDGVGVGA